MNAFLYRILYYTAQAVRGEEVAGRVAEMERNQHRREDEILARQWADMRRLFAHAWDTVPWYREHFGRAGVSSVEDVRGFDDWSKLPVLSKDDVRRFGDRMRSSRAPRGLAAATSGSSGQPVSVFRSHLSWANAHASLIRFRHWFGVEVGDKYAYLWGVPLDEEARRTAVRKDAFFNRRRLSAFAIDRATSTAFHREMVAHPARWAFGYPSAVTSFAEEIAAAGLDGRALRWRVVVTTAEVLHEHQRQRIAEVFGCPVADSYGCAEAGVVSNECERGGHHLSPESTRADVFTNADGESELLLTDLGNFSQPLIRYQVGDLVGESPTPACACGRGLPLIGRIAGRAGDRIELSDGRTINANLPSYIFKHHAKERTVREYQFVQYPDGRVRLRIVPGDAWVDVTTRPRLAAEVRQVLGFDAEIDVVDAIPRRGRAKHRDFVREQDAGGA